MKIKQPIMTRIAITGLVKNRVSPDSSSALVAEIKIAENVEIISL